ncbi:MAG: ubiquinol-cytochrome C chaperone family protein [Alphaproteobacteria bacterium]
MIFDGLFNRRQLRTAHSLYREAAASARRRELYLDCGVPDTVDGRFDMVVLHAFLLLRRLRREDRPGIRLGQGLFDVMFDHFDQSLREMGVGDLGVGRRVKRMAEAFYGRVAAYDEALENPADDALAGALGRNVYGATLPGSAELARLVHYVHAAEESLVHQSARALFEGRVAFPPVLGAPGSSEAAETPESR